MTRFGYTDSSDEERDSDELDSEDDEFPVSPPPRQGSVGVNGWNRPPPYSPTSSIANVAPSHWDKAEQLSKARSWSTANRTFHLSLSRSLSASPSPAPPASDQSIAALLSDLRLEQEATTASLHASFESRNKNLWAGIEDAIERAEREERDARKRTELEEVRKREELREREAKVMREAALKLEEENARKAVEEQQKQEKERLAKEKATAAAAAAAAAAPPAPKVTASVQKEETGENSPRAEFERWTAKMIYIKTAILPVVSSNPSFRSSCFAAKRSITPKIGQLTNSLPAISLIISQLDTLLTSLRPPPGAAGAEPYVWTLNHLAKSLVRQAETECTVRSGTAYPMGRVVIGLLLRGHDQLGEVLMARIVKKCFWVTGYWPAKDPSHSQADHLKKLGHAPPSASETLSQYSTRMSGLLALYAAILQTSPLEAPQAVPSANVEMVPAHFRPAAGWRLLVLLLRPPLITLEPTPLLLITFLEIAAPSLLELYGRQFQKVLRSLLTDGVRGGRAEMAEKSKGARVRLEIWLEDWEKSGAVEGARGRDCD